MKTPEKIKYVMAYCLLYGIELECKDCPYGNEKRCVDQVTSDALAYINQLENQFADAGKLLAAEPASKWVSVKERLPKKLEKVLVFIRTRYATEYEIAYLDDGEWVGPDGYMNESYVTHWMPLPEPPKEETK